MQAHHNRDRGAPRTGQAKPHSSAWRSPKWRAASIAAVYAASTSFAAVAPAAAQGSISFIRDTEIENLLKDYSRPIFKVAGQGLQNIAVRIVNQESFNAFVMDGRHVYIHTGALMLSETPNQVIGVIAHETGHIAGAHNAALRDLVKKAQNQQLLFMLLGIGMMAAGIASGSDAGREVAGLGSGTIAGGGELAIRSLLSERRNQESAADQAGFRYLSLTKQSGRGMLETFERLGQQKFGYNGDPYLQSHPTEAARLDLLRGLVEKSPYVDVRDPPELQLRHDLVRAKLYGYMTPVSNVMRVYPSSDNTLAARYARAIARNCSGKCANALGDVDALIKERPNFPYFWELKGHLLYIARKLREAEAPLREAIRLLKDEEAPQIQALLARVLFETFFETRDARLLPQIAELAEKAIRFEKEDEQSYRVLSETYYEMKKVPEAQLMEAEICLLKGNSAQAHVFAKRAQNEFAKRPPGEQRGFEAKRTRAADIVITTSMDAGQVAGRCR